MWQTDGQTDTARQHIPCYAYGSRGKTIIMIIIMMVTGNNYVAWIWCCHCVGCVDCICINYIIVTFLRFLTDWYFHLLCQHHTLGGIINLYLLFTSDFTPGRWTWPFKSHQSRPLQNAFVNFVELIEQHWTVVKRTVKRRSDRARRRASSATTFGLLASNVRIFIQLSITSFSVTSLHCQWRH